MTAAPISLTILRKGDINIIDLAERGVLIPRSETRVDDAFLREVSAEVGSIGLPRYGRDDHVAVVRDLQRIGALMFSHLLPEATQQRLRIAEPGDLYLRLDEALLQVPWELCYDGEQFLALKFRLGRQVITSAPLPQRESIRSGQGALRVLLIADPTETLPQASQEAEQLCELLGSLRGVEVTLLGGQEVRKTPLLLALQAHDLVHFAGHSRYDAQTPSHSGWVLHEGMLTAGELRKLAHPPSLVFSNSCQAGATAAWETGPHYDEGAFGIGSAFLLAGVQNYVGTFWVVQDEESTVFATAFYRSLTAGQSIGDALYQARQAIIAQRGWQGLTWASYMLYGDPAFTLLPTTQSRPLSSISPSAQPQQAQVMQRKLTAILSADVKGYSRLMGEDEEATIRTLAAHHGVMRSLIQQHRGRVVDSPGDNMLAEFASVVDAVRCAVEIQQELKTRNAELPPTRRMEFRIGINLGDVIVEGEKLYGDGVNIAARLEALAEPGGICISGTVYDQVENKLALAYKYIGEQAVKNIAKPVRTYRVVMDEAAATLAEQAVRRHAQHEWAPTPVILSLSKGAHLKRRGGLLLVGVVLIAATFVTVRYFSFPTSTQPPAPSPQAAPAALPLPDKPSIVVLPFDNMSKDPAQDYFSNGITEVLTSDLSRISSLFVIARNTAFTYQGKAVNIQAVGKELGVRYVLEGSVQKADQQVRITAQLIDATSGYHVWSEQYDRPLKDIFALQDEIGQKIVLALKVKLTPEEEVWFRRHPTANLEAYEYVLRGLESLYRYTKEANSQARQMFEKALALDPQYAGAYALLGDTYFLDWLFHWSRDPQNLERAFELAQRARALEDSLAEAHQLLSQVYLWKNQPEQAQAEAERAIVLDPNYADNYNALAIVLNNVGRPEEAIGWAEKAIRLDPRGPAVAVYLSGIGFAYRLTGRIEEAIATQKQVLIRDPNFQFAYTELAFSYVLQWAWQLSQDSQTLQQALEVAQKAIALNDSLPWAHATLGSVYLYQQQYDQALAEIERAVALAPTEAWSYAVLAEVLSYVGRTEDALAAATQALRLKPAVVDVHLDSVGAAYATAGRPAEAMAPLQRYLSRYPNILGAHLTLAAVYSELGKEAEAHAEATEVLRLNPNFSLAVHKERMPIKDSAMLERHITALRKAGLK